MSPVRPIRPINSYCLFHRVRARLRLKHKEHIGRIGRNRRIGRRALTWSRLQIFGASDGSRA